MLLPEEIDHLFYAPNLDPAEGSYTFPEEESKHAVRVLRLQTKDRIHLTDGRGTLCEAEIEDASQRHCTVRILQRWERFEQRNYELWMAVAPTKNMDRLEWFVEKATEMGVDRITPLLTDHCERRTVKIERLEKVALSAVKQSLKAYAPRIDELTPLKEWIQQPFEGKRLIAHCEPGFERTLLKNAVQPGERVMVLIGPEGDFSPEEIRLAAEHGFQNISLGTSRLRTETAALAVVCTVAMINQ